ncbi:LysR family transcriptional regulator [Sorangium sp. So ce1335]|uniref:LysR family transcriptional regulator n=1 Tax=Sorangium sp. So ce1335 TaxID=3133335 RepID=UPI003F6328F3
MDTLTSIEFFVTTVQAGSFAAGARRLGVTASAVSRRIARLEDELGVQLLARTTRSLRLTEDGAAFLDRGARIVEEYRAATETLKGTRTAPAGALRVDAAVVLGRALLRPKVADFLRRYPQIRLELTLRDQFIDPVAEGIDVAVRLGELRDSTLIARRVGEIRTLVCGSPAYFRRHGRPKRLDDLARHACLGFLQDGRPTPYRFAEGKAPPPAAVEARFHTNDADLLLDGAIAGLGLVYSFDFHVEGALARGDLEAAPIREPSLSYPVHALYPKSRHLLPRARVFVDFLVELFEARRNQTKTTKTTKTTETTRTKRAPREA